MENVENVHSNTSVGQERPKFELAENPEYSDLVINDIMFHGNEIRNPKEWYPELLYNSKLGQGGRIYTNKAKVAVYPVEGIGMVIEQRFPLSQKQKEAYRDALILGKAFKIYARPSGVKILFDKGIEERVSAHNKRVGYKVFDENMFNTETIGQLYTFDIIDGDAIIKVVM